MKRTIHTPAHAAAVMTDTRAQQCRGGSSAGAMLLVLIISRGLERSTDAALVVAEHALWQVSRGDRGPDSGARGGGGGPGGVCSRISAALSCDTVKTRFSGSGGAGRSPVRKFYGQALFSRQNLHAIRPTAPRWIALIETCTKHAKQGECGAARGLQERTCLRNAVATAMDARSCGSSRPDAKHSSSSSPGTPASAKRAQLRLASTLGGADEHCSDSAARRTFCTNGEPFAARPLVEKNPCAKRRHNL